MQLEIVVVGDYICITQTVTLGHLLPVVILELERNNYNWPEAAIGDTGSSGSASRHKAAIHQA